ncbi:hypothetical protein [Bacillus sp. JCM 19041]|uniref:hypothetical protein n=1 Tax=Bacillus sp. JCM 19041 TaxID=1460637 RepID=UPI0006D0E920
MSSDVFQEETIRLNEMNDRLETEEDYINYKIKNHDEDYHDLKQYLSEFTADPMEMYQNYRSMTNIDKTIDFYFNQLNKIKKLLEAPYFGRIDFQFEDGIMAEEFYIGKFNFADRDNDILIYDWRARYRVCIMNMNLDKLLMKQRSVKYTGKSPERDSLRLRINNCTMHLRAL